jgi:hypothetical protein
MPLLTIKWYTREDIQANRNRLYVFGDNFAESGRGGQARACRGEPNTIGIPTKRAPFWSPEDFLCDNDIPEWLERVKIPFATVQTALRDGIEVAIPADGLGTGLAHLPSKAPRIFSMLQAQIRYWHTIT